MNSIEESVLIVGSIVFIVLTFSIVFFIYLYQRKLIKRKIEFQKIEDLLKKQELQSAYALIEGQEKERKRIAQDLHDSLSSMLVTLNMYADSLLKKAHDPAVIHITSKIKSTAKQATEETRRISHNLDTGIIRHFGLAAAIKDLCEAVNGIGSMHVTHHVQLTDQTSKEVNVNIYRIIQELINNTLKHAQATKIHIELSQINYEYISLIYEDNGKGFDKDLVSDGIGLKNIQSRVDTLGASLEIDSKPGHGSTFIIELPIYGKN